MLESFAVVSKVPIVVSEYLFIEVAEEMKLFDTDVCALQSALEQAPEVFESVSVDATVNVPLGVVNDGVLEALVAQTLIGHESVCVDRAASFDVSGVWACRPCLRRLPTTAVRI